MKILAWVGGTWSTLVGLFLLSLILPRRIIRIWHARPRWLRRRRGLDHLEQVREIGDPAADTAFDAIAEELWDDDLAEACERAGWSE